MRSKKKLLIIVFLITTNAFCQIDNLKWKKVILSYEKPIVFQKKTYSFQVNNAGDFLKKSFMNAYWFFISDVDGDNCPFTPTCSSFFIDATEETNIFQGTLMFADRLTRDLNPVKRNNYPREKNGHYFDPASTYTLNRERIKYIPSTFIVDE